MLECNSREAAASANVTTMFHVYQIVFIQKPSTIGADGTVYQGMSRSGVRRNIATEGPSRQAVYADIDHANKPPEPPPRNFNQRCNQKV